MTRDLERNNIIRQVMKTADSNGGYPDFDCCLLKLKEVISGVKYLRNCKTKHRVETYIACDCNYTEALKKLLTTDSSITYDNLKESVAHANSVLRKKYGNVKGFCNKDTDCVVCMTQLLGMHDNEFDFLLPYVVQKASATKSGVYNITECKDELKFILLFSKLNFDRLYEKVNPQKLAYLCKLLTNPTSKEDVQQAYKLRSKLGSDAIIGVLEKLDNFDSAK